VNIHLLAIAKSHRSIEIHITGFWDDKTTVDIEMPVLHQNWFMIWRRTRDIQMASGLDIISGQCAPNPLFCPETEKDSNHFL
jgi:hypothetical protein